MWRIRRVADESRIPAYSRVGLWVATAFAAILAIAKRSVIELWHDIGSVTTPALLLPVGTALLGRGRLPQGWTLAAMVASFLVSFSWVLAKAASPATGYPASTEPIYAGLATSLLVYGAGWLRSGARRERAAASEVKEVLR